MEHNTGSFAGKVVLVTGAAHRVGAAIVRLLHGQGANIVLHYRRSFDAASEIRDELEKVRPNSVVLVQADLNESASLPGLIEHSVAAWGRLDVLVNNASMFYPTTLGSVTEAQWDDLFASNLKAPFFLAQAAMPHLRKVHGNVINIVDIHAERPLKDYPVYCMAKAGLVMLTKALAREFGGEIRVNAVAPGAIMWPDGMDEVLKRDIIARTALKRRGDPLDIAKAVLYLARDATYVTGQVHAVDGGRTVID